MKISTPYPFRTHSETFLDVEGRRRVETSNLGALTQAGVDSLGVE